MCFAIYQVVLMVNNPSANVGDIRNVEDSLKEGMAIPLQYCLENPMDIGAWWVTVHGIAKSWTQSSN